MTATEDSGMSWERITAELRAYRDAERQRWGEVDDLTLAAYLAGSCTAAERQSVELAMQEYPAVRDLIEGLRPMFTPVERGRASLAIEVSREATNEVAAAVAPNADRLDKVWRATGGTRELAEKLVVRTAPGGASTASGLASHFVEPSYTALGNDPNLRDFPQWRHIPLSPLSATLSIGCRRSMEPGAQWELILDCAAAAGKSEGESDVADRAELTIENASSGEVELQSGLRECLKLPVFLSDGEWRLTLTMEERIWKASIELRTND